MKTTAQKIMQVFRNSSFENCVLRLLAAWCAAAVVLDCFADGTFADLTSYAKVTLWFTVFWIVIVYLLLTVLRALIKKETDRVFLPVLFACFSVLTVAESTDWYYTFILTALWAVLVFYYDKKGYIFSEKAWLEKRAGWYVAAVAVIFVAVVGTTGVCRYLSYRAPNYDFGIFCQMFYSMKTRFLPLTTCERDTLLSHFAVHVSPICYLLLPFYAVFSSPVTLQLGQTLLLASAVIPLWLLCGHFALSNVKSALLAGMFLFFPAVACGTNYDFHENCFLLPLLLWMFYFFEKEKWLPMACFAVLTLLVKEDAAVYVIFFAVYVLFDRRKILPGVSLAAGAAIYFVLALWLLQSVGDGVMEGRYRNFIVNDGGLFEAVKNFIADPGYAFTQLLVDGNGDVSAKILFLFQMSVPLAFAPFCIKKVSRLTLLFPLLLVNLLTTYPYQFDIGFQYAFGSTAFLFYLCVLNVSELGDGTARRLLLTGTAACMLCFLAQPASRCVSYYKDYRNYRAEFSVLDEALSEIPDDASVVCSTFLLPHLSKRETLYEVYYHKPAEGEKIDYVILDARYPYEDFEETYVARGYTAKRTVEADGKTLLIILTEE